MRGKKAKLIRHIAFDIARRSGLPRGTEYRAIDNASAEPGFHSSQLCVQGCERAVINQVKKLGRHAKNFSGRLFSSIAMRAIHFREKF